MQKCAVCIAILLASPALIGACASRATDNVKETLNLCEALRGPDVDKGAGEVRFWFNSARADVSRKLWNRSGEKAVAAALARATSAEDRACLLHLQGEILNREVSGWWAPTNQSSRRRGMAWYRVIITSRAALRLIDALDDKKMPLRNLTEAMPGHPARSRLVLAKPQTSPSLKFDGGYIR